MNNDRSPLSDALSALGEDSGTLQVSLSNELVGLLSEQLYQSPLKAIEELVVNAYDADAGECRISVPEGSQSRLLVVVYDDGIGMDRQGLEDLWHIGRSNKRSEEIEKRRKRKQIGKFGIGKLATYAIAHKITHLTRTGQDVLMVTVDFRSFSTDPAGAGKQVTLPVRRIVDWGKLGEQSMFREACALTGVEAEILFAGGGDGPSWTFVILEDLKDKVRTIQMGRLRWVLKTAMPLRSDFRLFLNSSEIVSSKAELEPIVSFSVIDLPSGRIDGLSKATGEPWEVRGDSLFSESFPEGISGTAIVTEESLHVGKSLDLGRSHGFFIRVRDRLVNEGDPLFGLSPLSYETFNRFRADVRVDDLDTAITAPREGVGESGLDDKLQKLLGELFYEARARYEEYRKKQEEDDERKKEEERNYVPARLMEHPIADVISFEPAEPQGAEADETWFYLQIDEDVDPRDLARSLYSQPRTMYKYQYTQRGRSERLVVFNPSTSTFLVNADHDLVRAYAEDGRARWLLEDLVTAEALLEVYLREHGVPAHVVGQVLERRDALLRGLANDHMFSLEAISKSLRESAARQYDLEIALVAAARASGFVAKHLGGSGEPDGIARLTDYPAGEKKITLEAKSSINVPTLPQLDFAGLQEHMKKHNANGCLLVAPSYPGAGHGDSSAVANRARETRVSCWTVDQLAQVVGAAESRHLSARHVLDTVLERFSPDDVSSAVKKLLEEPEWEIRGLYKEILTALRALDNRLTDVPRTVDHIAAEVSRKPGFDRVSSREIQEAVRELASASQGALDIRDDRVILYASYDEIERRLSGLTGESGEPRRGGTFRGASEP